MPSADEILGIICKAFENSRDFNGICVSALTDATELTWPDLRPRIEVLVRSRRIDAAFGSHGVNPHIKRLPEMTVEGQVKGLELKSPSGICIYPTVEVVTASGTLSRYEGLPYTRRLAVAEAQLTTVFFELHVLERYFRDPRYSCRFLDRSGSISVHDQHYLSDKDGGARQGSTSIVRDRL
jgi:hypothetical protein